MHYLLDSCKDLARNALPGKNHANSWLPCNNLVRHLCFVSFVHECWKCCNTFQVKIFNMHTCTFAKRLDNIVFSSWWTFLNLINWLNSNIESVKRSDIFLHWYIYCTQHDVYRKIHDVLPFEQNKNWKKGSGRFEKATNTSSNQNSIH